MEYLKTETVTVKDQQYEIRELSYSQYQEVVSKSDEPVAPLLTIQYGCPRFSEKAAEDIGLMLGVTLVGELAAKIIDLSVGDGSEGND